MNYKQAFTLAEILLTLSIIGIVSAITIPQIIQSTQEIEYVAGARKTYSEISDALKRYAAEEGGDYTALFPTTSNSYYSLNKISKYFNISKICPPGGNKCWTETYNYLNPLNNGYGAYTTSAGNYGTTSSYFADLILASGARISILNSNYSSGELCHQDYTAYKSDADGNYILDESGNPIPVTGTLLHCGVFIVDTNGAKGPNKFGYDVFEIRVYPNRINGCGWTYYRGCVETMLKTGKMFYPKPPK